MKSMDTKGFAKVLNLYAKLLSWSARAAITISHRLGRLNNMHLFLTVLEAAKSKVEVLAGLVSGEGPLPDWRMAVFSPDPTWWRGKPYGLLLFLGEC